MALTSDRPKRNSAKATEQLMETEGTRGVDMTFSIFKWRNKLGKFMVRLISNPTGYRGVNRPEWPQNTSAEVNNTGIYTTIPSYA
jgi:hypothetical protein